MPQIVCKNLTIGYDKTILKDNINFTVNQGDYFVIIGENGAGKTTLLKTLLSLKKPISGEILFEGKLSNNEIGYLPQQATIKKDFPATNFEIVLSGCLGRKNIKAFYTSDDRKLAIDMMKKMSIAEYKDNSFSELSGGQQQRVLLARALCATKKVLILDEPVTGLDPKATKDMYTLINKLNKDDNITIIMISHDVYESIHYANKVLYIGNEVFFGTKDEYLNKFAGGKTND